jgi:uncharacterized repeat protein (TIGR01451 family)
MNEARGRPAIRVALAFAMIAALMAVVAPTAGATHVAPIFVAGNPTCGELAPGTTELKVEPVGDGTFSDGTLTVTIDVIDTGDGQAFNWTSNLGLDAVVAKGGDAGNLYLYNPEATSDTGLHAPDTNEDGQFQDLSHISFCYDLEPPDLEIEKSASSTTVDEGGAITYTIEVENVGDLPANNVTVTDDLDDALTSVSVTPSQGLCAAVGAGNTISCNLGTINGHATATVTINATAPVLDASLGVCTDELSNTATVDSTETDPEDSNEVIVTVVGDRQITINKSIPFVLDEDVTFEFTITGPGGPYTVFVTVEDGETTGSETLTGLAAGDYVVTEEDTTVYGEGSPVNIDLDPACSASAQFDNTADPVTAQVQKVTDPTGFEAGWTFELFADDDGVAGPSALDTLVATKVTVGANPINFGVNLEEKSYYVVETEQTCWESDGGVGCTFTVDYPDDIDALFSCVFTNTARGTIAVEKLVSGATSTDTFAFELRSGVDISTDPDTAGTLIDTEVVTADGDPVQLGGDLVPGTYTICEIVMPGWTTDLPNQYTLVIGLSNERVCTDVVVTVENQDLVLSVDNTPPPGGEQRTIGFWKNWTSCDGNGNQDPVLDETLALGPITIGTLVVDTCPEAVSVLDKRLANGKKAASDRAMNAASQLLAARLNVAAGAGTCAGATQAMTDAQAILATVGWDGTKVLTKQQVNTCGAQLNTLAGVLDAFNNGLLC